MTVFTDTNLFIKGNIKVVAPETEGDVLGTEGETTEVISKSARDSLIDAKTKKRKIG